MNRRKTDGYRLASKWCGEGILKGWYLDAAIKEIDRLIRRRMGEAWEEGWFDRDCHEADWDKNPYRGRKNK